MSAAELGPDPFGALRSAVWIGGGQWAGKSTVAGILAGRFGTTAWHGDAQDARAFEDRRIALRAREGAGFVARDREHDWVRRTPEEMAAEILDGFERMAPWVLDDLRGLESPMPIVAEGWMLRPQLIRPVLDDPRRMVVLVPTDAFRMRQSESLPRTREVLAGLSDPVRAHANRLERDRLIAEDAVRRAREIGVPVIEVDGTRDAHRIADDVATRFAPFLRPSA